MDGLPPTGFTVHHVIGRGGLVLLSLPLHLVHVLVQPMRSPPCDVLKGISITQMPGSINSILLRADGLLS